MAVTDAGHQVVGSFLSGSLQQQELFEVLVGKDTKKNADAAREALLSEIELEVTQGDELYMPQEETEEQVHFPVSYNGDYPSSMIVVAARADQLGLQEEELKHEIEHDVEERKLEEKLEYQSQIAEEDKHTNLAKQNKHVVASIAEEVEEMDVACSTDLGPRLRNVGENSCFINVIVQSLWHLRTFRGKFLRRSTPAHAHTEDPCIVCELHGIFTALKEAKEGDDVVSPTTLRIALSKWQDGNFQEVDKFDGLVIIFSPFFKGQKNDASEALVAILDLCYFPTQHDHSNELLKRDIREKHQNSYGSCSKPNIPHCILSTPLHVWESLKEPAHKISATLGALSTKIDIGVIYEGLDPGNTRYLISMVCYGLEHYICFVYNRAKENRILHDDDKVK
ncbi:Inactive ubiquitin carboxyl-terminal hydrolase 54, partial [Camellia lanceoleosa]